MNELAKAVLVLVLSAAAAVWLLGVALQLWPNTDQLAYGNPLPYLKVKFDRPANAVKFWVEDFGGVPYERVWLYVNGRLAASGGPGTDAAARCGDEVAAVVKYHSGVKKLEGRILCTEPIKAPGGGQQFTNSHFEIRTALAAQDVAGNADVTGLPVNIVGICRVRPEDNYYEFVVHITPRSPDVLICDASSCSTSKTYSSNCPLTYSTNDCPVLFVTLYSGPVDVLKTAGAPLAQYAGGGRLWLNLHAYYSGAYPYGWHVAMNGTTLAYCPDLSHSITETDVRTWTEYKEVNASAIYHLYLQWPDGKKTKATIAIYENKGGYPPYGFRVISSGTRQPPPSANIRIDTRYGSVNTTIEPITMWNALHLNLKFLEYLNFDPQARTLFVEALRYPTTVEFNIPRINRTYTETVVNHILIRPSAYDQSGRVLFVQMPYSFSLGAVLATTVLPVNITKPPADVTTLSGGTAYVFSK
jgi:hypothetical protein